MDHGGDRRDPEKEPFLESVPSGRAGSAKQTASRSTAWEQAETSLRWFHFMDWPEAELAGFLWRALESDYWL